MFLYRLFTSRIPAIGTDGVPAWHPFHDATSTRVLPDGSLVLLSEDMTNPSARRTLLEWAQVNSFSMEGIDPEMAITALVFSTMVTNEYIANRDLASHRLQLFAPTTPRNTQKACVRIDASYVAIRLVEVFDRTDTWDETEKHFHRRTNNLYR